MTRGMRPRRKTQPMKKLITLILAVTLLIGCADPAFQQYVANRQAAITAMPNGPAKFYEQERLDMQRRQQQAQAAVMAAAAGMAAGAAAANHHHNDTIVIVR